VPNMPWFRLYHEFITDPIIQSLSFEDQRHYLGVLCLKASGVLDRKLSPKLRTGIISKGLGITNEDATGVQARLMEIGLVDDQWQPLAWDKRQFQVRSGVVATPPGGNAKAYVYFIGEVDGSEVKIGYSKNPWARVKDFQTGNVKQLLVIATVATTESSEVATADAFKAARITGEWYTKTPIICSVIKEIQQKRIKTEERLLNYVAGYVVATKDTDTEADIQTTSASDPKTALWRLAKTLLGEKCGSLVGKQIKLCGEKKVFQALGETAGKNPAEPREYFLGLLKNSGNGTLTFGRLKAMSSPEVLALAEKFGVPTYGKENTELFPKLIEAHNRG